VKAVAVTAGALALLLAPRQAGAQTYIAPPQVHRAIVFWFGPAWKQAETVAWCESRWQPWARNGQFAGIFQLGAAERARFGDSSTAWGQARAASRYWRLAGWGPWKASSSCWS
jgi:hypothetical protein